MAILAKVLSLSGRLGSFHCRSYRRRLRRRENIRLEVQCFLQMWGAGWGTVRHFDTNLAMHAGCCYITVELGNIQAVAMGYSVKADLSVTNNSLSNPRETCCATSVISGQKIIDTNCDGQYEKGEPPGVGWTINLMSGSSVLQTATTDANGEFTFYNVANGTYVLQEVAQPGYTAKTPASGQYTVKVEAANSVQTFQFFNCTAPPPTPTPTPCARDNRQGHSLRTDRQLQLYFWCDEQRGEGCFANPTYPVQGSSFTLSQQLFNLSPPLHSGQSTTLTVKIKNVKPGTKVCFFLNFVAKDHPCCIIKVCPSLPVCGAGAKTPTPQPR